MISFTPIPKTYSAFFKELVKAGLLLSLDEAIIIALNLRNRHGPRWDIILDVCATRAAHGRTIEPKPEPQSSPAQMKLF